MCFSREHVFSMQWFALSGRRTFPHFVALLFLIIPCNLGHRDYPFSTGIWCCFMLEAWCGRLVFFEYSSASTFATRNIFTSCVLAWSTSHGFTPKPWCARSQHLRVLRSSSSWFGWHVSAPKLARLCMVTYCGVCFAVLWILCRFLVIGSLHLFGTFQSASCSCYFSYSSCRAYERNLALTLQ